MQTTSPSKNDSDQPTIPTTLLFLWDGSDLKTPSFAAIGLFGLFYIANYTSMNTNTATGELNHSLIHMEQIYLFIQWEFKVLSTVRDLGGCLVRDGHIKKFP